MGLVQDSCTSLNQLSQPTSITLTFITRLITLNPLMLTIKSGIIKMKNPELIINYNYPVLIINAHIPKNGMMGINVSV